MWVEVDINTRKGAKDQGLLAPRPWLYQLDLRFTLQNNWGRVSSKYSSIQVTSDKYFLIPNVKFTM